MNQISTNALVGLKVLPSKRNIQSLLRIELTILHTHTSEVFSSEERPESVFETPTTGPLPKPCLILTESRSGFLKAFFVTTNPVKLRMFR